MPWFIAAGRFITGIVVNVLGHFDSNYYYGLKCFHKDHDEVYEMFRVALSFQEVKYLPCDLVGQWVIDIYLLSWCLNHI